MRLRIERTGVRICPKMSVFDALTLSSRLTAEQLEGLTGDEALTLLVRSRGGKVWRRRGRLRFSVPPGPAETETMEELEARHDRLALFLLETDPAGLIAIEHEMKKSQTEVTHGK